MNRKAVKWVGIIIIITLVLVIAYLYIYANGIPILNQDYRQNLVVPTGGTDTWNQVIFPEWAISCSISDSPSNVFSSISSYVTWVFYKDSQDNWYSWENGAGGNDLQHIIPGETYYVYVNAPCTLTITRC